MGFQLLITIRYPFCQGSVEGNRDGVLKCRDVQCLGYVRIQYLTDRGEHTEIIHASDKGHVFGLESLPEDLSEDFEFGEELSTSAMGERTSSLDITRDDADREDDCGVDGDGSCDAGRDGCALVRRES